MSAKPSVELIQELPSDLPEVVAANCDISHLYLMEIDPSEVRRLAGRIAHVHLSDCDGKVHGDLPPGLKIPS